MKMQGNPFLTRGMTAGIAHEGELQGYNVGPGPWLAMIPIGYIGGRDYWTGRIVQGIPGALRAAAR